MKTSRHISATAVVTAALLIALLNCGQSQKHHKHRRHRATPQGSNGQANLLDFCTFPAPSLDSFRRICRVRSGSSSFVCDPRAVLTSVEAQLIDEKVRSNYSSCFCDDEWRRPRVETVPETTPAQPSFCLASGYREGMSSITAAVFLVDRLDLTINSHNQPQNDKTSAKAITRFDGCRYRDKPLPALASNFYAKLLRDQWNAKNKCQTDLLILFVANWYYRFANSNISYTDNEYSVSVSHGPRVDYAEVFQSFQTIIATRLEEGYIVRTIDEVLQRVQKIPLRQYLRDMKIAPAPLWAIVTICCCAVGGLILACIGNFVSSSGLRRTLVSSDKPRPQWRAGISAGFGWNQDQRMAKRKAGLFAVG